MSSQNLLRALDSPLPVRSERILLSESPYSPPTDVYRDAVYLGMDV